ncbi:cell wall / vacuolar inhibitor of fructosidase 2-like [Henckelia pumila]|uniref:cell wall / vacuolar inhibitor of fructosidase 2-like n=1 Tax=Henckelia pumila TaxID=405737 RepID=UPI003C6E3F6A
MAKQVFEIVLVLVVVLFFSQGNANITKDMALIESVCKKTHDFKLCVSTLISNPHSFNSTDVKGLARIMIGIIQVKTDGIIATIDRMSKNESDPLIRRCFNDDCFVEYDKGTELLQQAIEDLESGSSGQAITDVHWAWENAETCQDCFVELKRKSPVTAINSYFGALCNIAEDIMSILLHNLK